MASSRCAARSTRRRCRRSRAARSQHVSRRSAAVCTRVLERRGPSRREGSAWKDDGSALDHDTTGTSRGTRAALISASDAESMLTIGRKQRFHVPRSKVNRRLRLGAPVSRRSATVASDIAHRHRARMTRSARVDAVAGRYSTVENTRSRAVLGSRQGHDAYHGSEKRAGGRLKWAPGRCETKVQDQAHATSDLIFPRTTRSRA